VRVAHRACLAAERSVSDLAPKPLSALLSRGQRKRCTPRRCGRRI